METELHGEQAHLVSGSCVEPPRQPSGNRVVSSTLERAYAACAALAADHYENFPVASRLLPASMRPHVAAVYAFARVADDIADEGQAPAAERQAQLAASQVS